MDQLNDSEVMDESSEMCTTEDEEVEEDDLLTLRRENAGLRAGFAALQEEHRELRERLEATEASLKGENGELRARVAFLEERVAALVAGVGHRRSRRLQGQDPEEDQETQGAEAEEREGNAQDGGQEVLPEEEVNDAVVSPPKKRGRPPTATPSEFQCWGCGRHFTAKTKRELCRPCGKHFCASHSCHVRPKHARICEDAHNDDNYDELPELGPAARKPPKKRRRY